MKQSILYLFLAVLVIVFVPKNDAHIHSVTNTSETPIKVTLSTHGDRNKCRESATSLVHPGNTFSRGKHKDDRFCQLSKIQVVTPHNNKLSATIGSDRNQAIEQNSKRYAMAETKWEFDGTTLKAVEGVLCVDPSNSTDIVMFNDN